MKYGVDIHQPSSLWTLVAWAPSRLYAVYQHLRGWLFAHGWRTVHRLRTPVVSVGNLTVGGTGKTPVTAYLAEYLREEGCRPVIISRGYGGHPHSTKESVKVVSDGRQVLLDAAHAGDEPFLLASRLPGVPVICHPDRVRAGRWAEEHLQPDVILLDDGFQHMRLHRDFNLLLMDAGRPLGNGQVLPAGPLREPPRAIRRADVILLTRCPDTGSLPPLFRHLGPLAPDVPIYSSHFRLAALLTLGQGAALPLSHVSGKRVVAFCGLAHPQQFFRMLESAGLEIRDTLAFDDHQTYSAAEAERIAAACRRAGAGAALTTGKDLVKMQSVVLPCPLYGVDMALHLHQPEWLARLVSLVHGASRPAERQGN